MVLEARTANELPVCTARIQQYHHHYHYYHHNHHNNRIGWKIETGMRGRRGRITVRTKKQMGLLFYQYKWQNGGGRGSSFFIRIVIDPRVLYVSWISRFVVLFDGVMSMVGPDRSDVCPESGIAAGQEPARLGRAHRAIGYNLRRLIQLSSSGKVDPGDDHVPRYLVLVCQVYRQPWLCLPIVLIFYKFLDSNERFAADRLVGFGSFANVFLNGAGGWGNNVLSFRILNHDKLGFSVAPHPYPLPPSELARLFPQTCNHVLHTRPLSIDTSWLHWRFSSREVSVSIHLFRTLLRPRVHPLHPIFHPHSREEKACPI